MLRVVSNQMAVEATGAAMSTEVHSVRPGEVVKWPEGSFPDELQQVEFAPLMASAASNLGGGFITTPVRPGQRWQLNQPSMPRFMAVNPPRPVPAKPKAPIGALEWLAEDHSELPPKLPAWPFLAGALANFTMVVANIVLFRFHLTGPWTGALVAANLVVGCIMGQMWSDRRRA